MNTQPSALPRFLALYAALFAAFGVASPFFAAFLAGRALQPEAIGVVLAAGTALRLVAGPLGARLADRLGAPRLVLVGFAAAASGVAFLYLPAQGFWLLLLVSLAHASVLAPINPIADALALEAAMGGVSCRRFEYGWVRGAGSAAFILGTLLAGPAVGRFGLDAIIWLNGVLLGIAAWWAHRLPDVPQGSVPQGSVPQGSVPKGSLTMTPDRAGGVGLLLRLPAFRRLMLVAALIQGSHALHDGFIVIHWESLGIGDATISLLWSESVAAEVVVFLLVGPWVLDRLSPAAASMLAAAAGVLRWAVLAATASILASALVEPLHGLTFALQHLACMRLIGAVVPPELAATAQAFYGTVAVGAATAVLTLGSGTLYAHLGAEGFWVMAGMCAIAMPVAWGLRQSGDAVPRPAELPL
jgi:MFS transporter, PPP family, 3-phenylpropionic acid transporter